VDRIEVSVQLTISGLEPQGMMSWVTLTLLM